MSLRVVAGVRVPSCVYGETTFCASITCGWTLGCFHLWPLSQPCVFTAVPLPLSERLLRPHAASWPWLSGSPSASGSELLIPLCPIPLGTSLSQSHRLSPSVLLGPVPPSPPTRGPCRWARCGVQLFLGGTRDRIAAGPKGETRRFPFNKLEELLQAPGPTWNSGAIASLSACGLGACPQTL